MGILVTSYRFSTSSGKNDAVSMEDKQILHTACLNQNAAFLVSLSQRSRGIDRERTNPMEGIEGGSSGTRRFTLPPTRISNEDIIFCVDVDAESLVEMKSTGFNGKPITRLDAIKQAILLFVNSKLSINPDHRFAFATLAKTASWVLSFSLFFLSIEILGDLS